MARVTLFLSLVLFSLFLVSANAAGWPFGGSAESSSSVISSPSAAAHDDPFGDAATPAAIPEDTPVAVPTQEAVSSTTPPPYNGTEYTWTVFVFRPALFKNELGIILALGGYVLISALGRKYNTSLASGWVKAHRKILESQFASVGTNPDEGILLVDDGPSRFWSYASGRRNVSTLQIRIETRPRNDIGMLLYETVRGAVDFTWNGRSDFIELDFALDNDAKAEFIWAVVDKRYMKDLTEARWDVQTLTSNSDSSLVPSHYALFSESGAVTEAILKEPASGLKDFFASSDPGLRHFISLVVSDCSLKTPPESSSLNSQTPFPTKKSLILTLKFPSNNKDTTALVTLVANFVDFLANVHIPAESANKLRKKRKEKVDILLEDYRKDLRSRQEDLLREKRKKEQEQRFAALSAEEQRKAEKRERKREISKSQGKIKRK